VAQYQNEYEGMGNALMNIGTMYYNSSEKRKEEERRRKELEDERKYTAAESAKEWERKAPYEAVKTALAEARIAAAQAEKTRIETQTYMPKTQMLGNVARTTMPVRDAAGNLSYESTDEIMQSLNPTQPRVEKSPYVRVGNDLVDTTTMQPVYKGKDKAAAAKPLYTSAQLLSAKQSLIQLQAKQASEMSPRTREALQPSIDAQMAIVKDIEAGLTAPLMNKENVPQTSTPAPGVKMTAGGSPASKAAFEKWTAAYKEALALGATKDEAEILANEAAGE